MAVTEHTHRWAEQALDTLTTLAGVRRAGLAVIEGGGRRLDFTSAERPGTRPMTWCEVDAYDDVPLNTAVRTGRALIGSLGQLNDTHPDFVERQRGTGSRALAAVPLVAGGRTLGGFVLFYRDPPGFDATEVAELSALGARLGARLRRAQERPAVAPVSNVRAAEPGSLVVQFWVPGDPGAVGPARQRLRDTLSVWDVDVDASETAALCMTELVTNAVVHSGSGCWVEVVHESATITVVVRSSRPSQLSPGAGVRDLLPVHGRGLQIVAALTSSWGADPDGDGLTSWFVMEA